MKIMYARLFSYLSLVMCAYGGAYALWCLPSSLSLYSIAKGDGIPAPEAVKAKPAAVKQVSAAATSAA